MILQEWGLLYKWREHRKREFDDLKLKIVKYDKAKSLQNNVTNFKAPIVDKKYPTNQQSNTKKRTSYEIYKQKTKILKHRRRFSIENCSQIKYNKLNIVDYDNFNDINRSDSIQKKIITQTINKSWKKKYNNQKFNSINIESKVLNESRINQVKTQRNQKKMEDFIYQLEQKKWARKDIKSRTFIPKQKPKTGTTQNMSSKQSHQFFISSPWIQNNNNSHDEFYEIL